MKKIAFSALVFIVGSLALAGCSVGGSHTPDDNNDHSVTRSPDPTHNLEHNSAIVTTSDRNSQLEDASTVFIMNDTEAYVALGGSGSCPPIIDKAIYQDELLTITLDGDFYEDRACTADYRIYTFDLELKTNEFSEDTSAKLVKGDFAEELKVVTKQK